MSGNLTAQQRRMADHLRDPQGKAPPEGIEERRLQVYRDLVYRNIKGFIDSTFPVLCSLHSEAEWEALVREFIREYRCHSPLFLEISEEFIGFLASREQDPTRPWMLELVAGIVEPSESDETVVRRCGEGRCCQKRQRN